MRRREKDDFRNKTVHVGDAYSSKQVEEGSLISIFATNFIEMIDDAASRKGRFAIRKGVGAIPPEAVRAYIDKELGGKTPYGREIATRVAGVTAYWLPIIGLCKLAQKLLASG